MPNNQPFTTPPAPDMNSRPASEPVRVQTPAPTPVPSSGSSLPLMAGILIVVLVLLAGAYYLLAPMMMQVGIEPVPAGQPAAPEVVVAPQQTDQVAAELEAFSTTELDAELSQIEAELAQ